MKRMFRNGLILAASALALAACGGGASDDDSIVLHRGNNAEPYSLDPHKANGTWENNIIGDMLIGLFQHGPDGQPVPGMAQSWEVSEDGLTWTFTLREANWSDGVPVTANDFVYAIQRIANPETNAQYVSILYPIRGVEAVVNGGDMSELGVSAPDERTLVIELENPAPFLPEMLTHYTAFPVPAHVVEEHGDAWIQPENIEVNGPYKLQEWRQNNYVYLARNESFFENDQTCIDEIFYYPTRDPSAGARRVRNGELHINNEFPGQDLEFLMREIPDHVRITPFMGTVYYSIDTENEKFTDPRVRNALGMVIDRQFLADEIQIGGWEPAYSLVPPQVANYPGGVAASWRDMPREERLVEARRLLEEAGYGPDNPLEFLYTYRATGDNPRIAPVVQANWSEIADWVIPEIQVRDTQLHYAAMRAQDFEIGDGGWIADYNDPYNFIFLGETRSQPMNYSRYSNPEFDALVTEANQQLDVETRGAMLAEAEQMYIDDMPIIPVLYYIKRNLVSPEVTGWVDNAVDIHRTRYLCLADDGEEG